MEGYEVVERREKLFHSLRDKTASQMRRAQPGGQSRTDPGEESLSEKFDLKMLPSQRNVGKKTDRDGDVWSLKEARRSSKVAEVIKQAFSEVCPQRKVAWLRLSPGGGFGIPMATRMRFQSSSSGDERKTH